MTTDMNVTDIISDTTSNQGSNSFILKVNSLTDTLLIEVKSKGRPISGPPCSSSRSLLSGQRVADIPQDVADLAADAAHRGNRGNCDQGHDQRVLDRRGAAHIAG